VRELRRRGIDHDVVQRENRRQFHGRSCDVLVFCAGNSMKWKAAEDPHFDFTASVAHLSYYLHEIRAAKVVVLSDTEVYPDLSSLESTREEVPEIGSARSTYAYHKLLAEDMTQRFAPRHLILRRPTLVGPGLRRNVLFDLLHTDRPLRETQGARVNVLHTDRMAEQLMTLVDGEAEGVFNLGAPDTIGLAEAGTLMGRVPSFRPDPGAQTRKPELCLDRVRELVELETCVAALERYRAEFPRQAESA
jgi:nucleoside-diphosphate-sugar epimerase